MFLHTAGCLVPLMLLTVMQLSWPEIMLQRVCIRSCSSCTFWLFPLCAGAFALLSIPLMLHATSQLSVYAFTFVRDYARISIMTAAIS